MDAIHQTLESLGLSSKEREVYLMLLSVGTSPPSVLGRRLRLSRSTAQYTCDQLVKMGIVRMARRGNANLYSPEPPEKLLLLVQRQQLELSAKERSIHAVLEPLRRMMNPHAHQPSVRYYEGPDAIANVLQDLLEDLAEGEDIMSYSSPMTAEMDRFGILPLASRFSAQRAKRGIFNRLIATDVPTSYRMREQDAKRHRETRILRGSAIEETFDIILCSSGTYILTVGPQGVFAAIVQNEVLAKMQCMVFEALWASLE